MKLEEVLSLPPGTRVRSTMNGDRGTVERQYGDDHQVSVRWDNGVLDLAWPARLEAEPVPRVDLRLTNEQYILQQDIDATLPDLQRAVERKMRRQFQEYPDYERLLREITRRGHMIGYRTEVSDSEIGKQIRITVYDAGSPFHEEES